MPWFKFDLHFTGGTKFKISRRRHSQIKQSEGLKYN